MVKAMEYDGVVVVTEDGNCGECGAHVESAEANPGAEGVHFLGYRVTLSYWVTFSPCGHSFQRATNAQLG